MKKVVLLTTVMVLGVLLSSGVALAVTKTDNNNMSPSESLRAATQGDPTNIEAEELTKTGE